MWGSASSSPKPLAVSSKNTASRSATFRRSSSVPLRRGAQEALAKTLKMDPAKIQETSRHRGRDRDGPPPPHAVKALEEAKPGDKILLVSFGSGCDALYFEVTDESPSSRPEGACRAIWPTRPISPATPSTACSGACCPVDIGLRGEADLSPAGAGLEEEQGHPGPRGFACQKCGTPQYPPQRICANPACGAVDQWRTTPLRTRRERSSATRGTCWPPPTTRRSFYGYVELEGGGRIMCNFTDCTLQDLKVGAPVTFTFRKKYYDAQEGHSLVFLEGRAPEGGGVNGNRNPRQSGHSRHGLHQIRGALGILGGRPDGRGLSGSPGRCRHREEGDPGGLVRHPHRRGQRGQERGPPGDHPETALHPRDPDGELLRHRDRGLPRRLLRRGRGGL